ncbi:MAG: membrane protein insertase YidC [Erythrobacter sp.]|uniref:DoxX family protein n=1 Tax=Erythrobacter donghaensis TaxID=267135 RepID=UPI00093C551A|nr:DoxX family protein [Erythrobacter donghaensis]MBA4041623.1 membrane protein insertase YidC [Sphingobium sp.]MBA4046853.1 membrane protein insertase YidC [Erythrobacter sp.]
MRSILSAYDRVVQWLAGQWVESGALLLTRLALAGVFWRSGRTKVVEGSWLTVDETQYFLFEEFGLPVSPELVVPVTVYAEFLLPILVAFGLLTRLSALGLLVMTLVIQLLIFPEAWWPTHSLWAAMALVLVSRGGGMVSLDAVLARLRK